MDEVIKVGLIEQLRVLKIYLNDYKKELVDNIISEDEYLTLKNISEGLYKRITSDIINEQKEKEIELLLKKQGTAI